MTRIFFFILGFLLMTLGFTFIILYFNLLNTYNFNEYVNFITTRIECYLSLVGLIILNLSLFKGEKKYGIYL
ncbi:MAG: hypothetical protein IJO57_04795 [Bacilli bacterium]|nr:hypothetical protein [Bacilli bacterium]